MEQRVFEVLLEVLKGHVHRCAEVLGQGLDALIENLLHFRMACPPGFDRAIVQRFGFIRHQQSGIGSGRGARAFADGAGTEVSVEGEMLRRKALNHVAGARIGEGGGVADDFLAAVEVHEELHLALVPVQGAFDGFHEALAGVSAHDEAVDDDLRLLRFCLVQLEGILQLHHGAIQSHTHEALALEFFK